MSKLLMTALACLVSLSTAAQDKGRIVVAVGVCEQSNAEHPVVWFRKVDKSADFNARGAAFGQWDYADATGKFDVRSAMLAEGDWEMYRYEFTTRSGNLVSRYYPRNDFSHRFRVEPGKVVDLGRYCAATQSVGEKFPDSDRIWNQVVRLGYLHVSANREADLENARKPEGAGAPLELVNARPSPPERVAPGLRSRFIEPRVIARPGQSRPTTVPTVPVQ